MYCLWLDDEYGYGYVYHDDYCITFLMTFLFMHVIVYRCKLNTWLN
jgi:hypothetical protein